MKTTPLGRGVGTGMVPLVVGLMVLLAASAGAVPPTQPSTVPANRPNIVLCMTDDQGWGDTSYNGHPVLDTPELDAMAEAGIRFHRFYAAHFNCSPTRASVLTGRHPNRYGCFSHGYPIGGHEVTLAHVAGAAGYATGHFGKWHLAETRGPSRALLPGDPLHPGRVGFDEWVSASNFFDLDPVLGRNGAAEQFIGDSSDVTTDEALKFIRRSAEAGRPFLALVWFASPHNPHRALAGDKAPYADLSKKEQNYYGELVAVDRNVGRLRRELRALGVADDTIVWFCSDNGGNFGPASTGWLRGAKGTLWEGGVRVPGILEWPARVTRPVVAAMPCSTMDIYPTLVELLGVEVPNQPRPIDGISLVPLIDGKMTERPKPVPFWDYTGPKGGHADPPAVTNQVKSNPRENHAVWLDFPYKLHLYPNIKAKGRGIGKPFVLLYDLSEDPAESRDLAARESERVKRMRAELERWQDSVENSLMGRDYLRVAAE